MKSVSRSLTKANVRALENKIPPPVVLGLVGLGMWLVARWLPEWGFELPFKTWIAWLLVGLGILCDVGGMVAFRQHKTTVNPLDPSAASYVVTSGIYRATRNPMYLGMLMLLMAWGVYLAHPVAALLIPGFVLYLNRFQIGPEERALASKFGEEYQRYLNAVRRWI